MVSGLRGSLLSRHFAERLLASAFSGRLGEATRERARTQLRAWWKQHGSQLGPASSRRAVWDRAAVPLARILGYDLAIDSDLRDGRVLRGVLHAGTERIGLLVGHWSDEPDGLWRDAVVAGLHVGSRWCFCANGRCLRVVDAARTYARFHAEFELERVVGDAATSAVFWGLMRADAFREASPGRSLFDEAVDLSSRHGLAVGRALRSGVLQALELFLDGLIAGRRGRGTAPSEAELAARFEESLTIVYRILFLLFAEARALVPVWHPVYRDHYTVESLCRALEGSRRPRGLWETLQAIARLSHDGCRAGMLVVPPFNGRLFSAARSPAADTGAVADETAAKALLALSTAPGSGGTGRVRIDYGDLGVEQLGSVYETVLEYEPACRPGATASSRPERHATLRPGGGRRKSSGSFYTPVSVTEFLVRRALHPLTREAGADGILGLRVLDPAMGSAAFLVAACRYLAGAYEEALIREGSCAAADLDERDRAGFRRLVARRCLFGVDLNPTAVQLARLSLWLATLSAGEPLTFLDHHLIVGDSLIGASPDDLARRPALPGTGRPGTRRDQSTLPLLEEGALEPAVRQVVPERARIAGLPDDTLEAVRDKEKRLGWLSGPGGPLQRWKQVADLWCAMWLWEEHPQPGPGAFADLAGHLFGKARTLPARIAEPLLAEARRIAAARRFAHWTFEFPEAFFAEDGRALPAPGFDAVIGNPPWDMIRADSASAPDRGPAGADNARLTRFVRHSGVYRFQAEGHLNRYQLFLERAVSLARPGGRIGLVLPSGLATDHGSTGLRRLLLERCDVDSLTGVDNRRRVFPIHRSVRFLLLTATAGSATNEIACRFGIQTPDTLDALPDASRSGQPDQSVVLTTAFIRRCSGDDLVIPELRSPVDVAILERIAAAFPELSSTLGWQARFGRELNATDDREHFTKTGDGLPVMAGRHITPFRVHPKDCCLRIPRARAARLLDERDTFGRARLAYRDVASATNRLTLIAAIVPAGVVTTHTLFCLKTPLDPDDQIFLCGILNSFVANYLVRFTVTTHLTVRRIERLPVPRPAHGDPLLPGIREAAESLSRGARDAAPVLQALVAELYGLSPEEFRHVLGTFPLVDGRDRDAALESFLAGRRNGEAAPAGPLTRAGPPPGSRRGHPGRTG
jgi:hypothetical protein